MVSDEQIDDEERPLSAAERKALRALLESDRRVTWFWGTVRVWAAWVTAVIVGVTITWDSIKKVIKLAVGA